MNSNVNLSFDIDELITLQDNIDDSCKGIEDDLGHAMECFADLKTNVTGSQINSLISNIEDKIGGIKQSMSGSFKDLSKFLSGQMDNYSTTYEQAKTKFMNALEIIENNF